MPLRSSTCIAHKRAEKQGHATSRDISISLDDPHSLYNPQCKRVHPQSECRALWVNSEGGILMLSIAPKISLSSSGTSGAVALRRCGGAVPSPIKPPASFTEKIVQR
jgi:hypothetical protein